ncbi:MAG: hypothetical protein M1832_003664 [Thelocarpon impressellum]|nr:MAG: hypothetical protein M1832_003664 [Thelocarpon impressellum]
MQDRLTSMTMLPEHGGSPDYPAYSSGAEPSTAELNDLNEAIYRQFKHHRENGLDFELMIAKICYNLLVSTTPPNADTYNILINHLRRLKENTLVRCVLDSYFESRVTPNEVTISSILKFYTVSRDASGFHRFLRLMKGYDGGLGRAKRRTNLETCNSRALEDWRNYRCDGGMVIKKAPRNKEVYGALIHGALIFSGMHTAMDFLWEMIEDGLQANLKLLTSMLQACARTQDWESGQAIWEEMRGLHPEHDSLDGRAYFWMLRLCRACGKEDAFQTIYKQAAKRFVERPPAPTRRSQYLVDIQNGDRRLALGDWKLPPLPAEPVHAPVQESALGPRSIPSDAQPEGNIVSTDFGDSSFLKQYDLRAATMMPEDRIEVSTFAGVG